MRKPTNMGASVRARLLTLANERKQPFQVLLTRYVLERLLYRLSSSAHSDRFVLKGAVLLTSWFTDPLRPTQDLDLLGFGLGRANSRMKDFYDIWALSKSQPFGDELARAIRATFDRRKTVIPSIPPDCLTPEFAADQTKQQQWTSFVVDVASKPTSLTEVVVDLATFLMPHARAAQSIETTTRP